MRNGLKRATFCKSKKIRYLGEVDSENKDFQIYDTSYWNVVLNPNQTYFGRSVVVLKRACGDLAAITEEELLDFFVIVKRMETLFRSTFDATMFNWSCLMNDAYQKTPPNPQVHWHCLPR